MSDNRISLVITPEQRQAAATALEQVIAALPGLVSLDPMEIRELHHFVNKNEIFGRGVVRMGEAYPDVLPKSLSVANARADLDALDALRPLLTTVQRLQSQLEHTVALLGHDVMDFAYDGYSHLKVAGTAQGLEELRRELGGQFRRRRRAEEPTPA